MALGCTVGQAITGVSTLALGSFLTFAAIVAGGFWGLRVLERQIMAAALTGHLQQRARRPAAREYDRSAGAWGRPLRPYLRRASTGPSRQTAAQPSPGNRPMPVATLDAANG